MMKPNHVTIHAPISQGGFSCTSHSLFSACREGSRCTPRSRLSHSHGGRGCTPRTCVSACRGGRGCIPRSPVSACREGRGCIQRSCFLPCRVGSRCTPRSCLSACREVRGCTPRSCLYACREGRGCTPHNGFSPFHASTVSLPTRLVYVGIAEITRASECGYRIVATTHHGCVGSLGRVVGTRHESARARVWFNSCAAVVDAVINTKRPERLFLLVVPRVAITPPQYPYP